MLTTDQPCLTTKYCGSFNDVNGFDRIYIKLTAGCEGLVMTCEKKHYLAVDFPLPSSPAALTSILSTPEPMRTMIRNALNFSKSSLVRMMVCHMRAPTASLRTFSWISDVDCASQNATVATSFSIGISTVQSRPSRRATSGLERDNTIR